MKTLKIFSYLIYALLLTLLVSCDEDILEEKPMDFFSPENAFVNKAGFESAIVGLHEGARAEMANGDNNNEEAMNLNTDIATTASPVNAPGSFYSELNPTNGYVSFYWNWAYNNLIQRANLIISRAESPQMIWKDEEEKNRIVAEARFFRGYAYNTLVNLYGGVPIIDTELTEARFDFTRATREEVLEFVKNDFEFASQWLPVETKEDGRIVKAAADHFLAEVYISLQQYDQSIEASSRVINSGLYKLMTQRFGDLNRPGDVFSDLFWSDQQNRSSGNMETIWAVQVQFAVNGGIPGDGGNAQLRTWGPRYYEIKDPDNQKSVILCDSLGRPNGWNRVLNYVCYDIWAEDWNDMRNSRYNVRRDYYYNTGKYKGQKVQVENGFIKGTNISCDTMAFIFPWFRKIEGIAKGGAASGRNYNDFIKIRLPETYLLRAEAFLLKGDKQKAADDINVLRARANAIPVTSNRVDIDYILDERARELVLEERRMRTLVRMGKLVERVRKYNFREKNAIQDFHALWPIPQSAIDANKDAPLDQNPGY